MRQPGEIWVILSEMAVHGGLLGEFLSLKGSSVNQDPSSTRPDSRLTGGKVQGVRMRPINIKPASVVGGSVTATSASRISFSRTMLPDPFDVLLGAG
jgi:hypothetical protein